MSFEGLKKAERLLIIDLKQVAVGFFSLDEPPEVESPEFFFWIVNEPSFTNSCYTDF